MLPTFRLCFKFICYFKYRMLFITTKQTSMVPMERERERVFKKLIKLEKTKGRDTLHITEIDIKTCAERRSWKRAVISQQLPQCDVQASEFSRRCKFNYLSTISIIWLWYVRCSSIPINKFFWNLLNILNICLLSLNNFV